MQAVVDQLQSQNREVLVQALQKLRALLKAGREKSLYEYVQESPAEWQQLLRLWDDYHDSTDHRVLSEAI